MNRLNLKCFLKHEIRCWCVWIEARLEHNQNCATLIFIGYYWNYFYCVKWREQRFIIQMSKPDIESWIRNSVYLLWARLIRTPKRTNAYLCIDDILLGRAPLTLSTNYNQLKRIYHSKWTFKTNSWIMSLGSHLNAAQRQLSLQPAYCFSDQVMHSQQAWALIDTGILIIIVSVISECMT